jgi:hypothetical protein
MFDSLASSYSMSRRLEDRIRRLCAQAVNVTDPAETNAILQRLTAALHEHVDRFRRKLSAERSFPPERRHSQS